MFGQCQTHFSVCKKDLEKDNGLTLVLVLKRSGTVSVKTVHKEYGAIWLTEWMLLEFAESGCPNFRATSPLFRSRLKSKGDGKLSIHYAADLETIEADFRIIVDANQLSLYGAIAEICEEYHCGNKYYMHSFFSHQLSSDYITVGVAARNYFQLQLQPRSLHGIIFQFWLQPRSRYGKTASNDNIR